MSTGYVNGGERVTRKSHCCNYCLATVLAGSSAHWWVWADEGRATTCYAHPRCVEMARSVDAWDDEPMDPAEFRDVCAEAFPDEPFPWTEPPT